MAKKKADSFPPTLTETEQDLLPHIQDGYQLETDSLGGNPVLRRLKDNEEKYWQNGERGRNRTFNLLIKSQLLCQLSYAPTVGILLAGQFVIVTFHPCPVIVSHAHNAPLEFVAEQLVSRRALH